MLLITDRSLPSYSYHLVFQYTCMPLGTFQRESVLRSEAQVLSPPLRSSRLHIDNLHAGTSLNQIRLVRALRGNTYSLQDFLHTHPG